MSHPALFLRSRCILVLALCSLPFLGGCDGTSDDELDARSLFALVVDSEDLSLLEETVNDTPLESLLQGQAEYTFFAPTNFALDRLGGDLLERLRNPNSRDVLLKILRRHLVPGRLLTTDLRDGDTLTPLEGPPLVVRIVDDEITVAGVPLTVRRSDFETGNGVIHYVDGVARDHLTLQERLRVTPLASRFADILATTELDALFEDGEPYSVFIPIDNAFALFGGEELLELYRFANRDVLLKVLRHHIVPGRVQLSEIGGGKALAPLDGSPLPVRDENGTLFVAEARVIASTQTEDGVIYLVDRIVASHLDLAERLQITPDRELYREILAEAGLLDALRGEDVLTVFAPSDEELEQLGTRFLDALRQRPDLLLRTAQFGLVPGRVEYDDLLQAESLTTLGGYVLDVDRQSASGIPLVTLGKRGSVSPSPVETRNGLIYEISTYLIPPDLNLEERAVFARLYRFLNLIEEAGLSSLLSEDEGPYTIFGPTDEGVSGQVPPASELADALRYHIVPGSYDYSTLQSAAPVTLVTLQGGTVEVTFNPLLGTFVNEAGLVTPNNRATNGIIHTISGVLRPPQEPF